MGKHLNSEVSIGSVELPMKSEVSPINHLQPTEKLTTVVTSPMSELSTTSKAQEKTIFYITYALGSAYADAIAPGVQKASKDLGCDLIYLGTPDKSPEERIDIQIQLLDDAVASYADAVIIRVVDRTALAEAVSKVYHAGVPIIIVGGMVETMDYSVSLIVDDINMGKSSAAEILEKLRSANLSEDNSAEIALQIGSVQSQATIDRLEGFKEYLDENAPLKWVVLWDDIKINDGDADKAIRIGREFLDKYPNIKGFYAPNTTSTVGFSTALKESNRTDVTLVGFDLTADLEELIRNENYNVSTILYPEYLMGYNAMMIAHELANGGTVAEKIVDMGVFAVDIENIDDPEVQLWINGA